MGASVLRRADSAARRRPRPLQRVSSDPAFRTVQRALQAAGQRLVAIDDLLVMKRAAAGRTTWLMSTRATVKRLRAVLG